MTHTQAREKLQMDMQLRGFSKQTMETYDEKVHRFLNTTNKAEIETLAEIDFRSYLQLLHQKNLKASTMYGG